MIFIDTDLAATSNEQIAKDVDQYDIDKIYEKWKSEIWAPYEQQKGVVRTLILEVAVTTFDDGIKFTTVKVELTTNATFFRDLLESYLDLGTAFIQRLFKSGILGSITYHTKGFVFNTIAYVERVMALRLLEIESAASKDAISENNEIEQRLKNLTKLFKYNVYPKSWEIVSLPLDVDIVDGDEVAKVDNDGFALHHSKNELYKLLQKCFDLDSKMKLLKSEIDRRNKVDGRVDEQRAKNRAKYPYKEKLLQVWLGPYKDLMLEFQDATSRLYQVFPPALMILDKLESDIKDFWLNQTVPGDRQYRASRDVELKYDTLMYRYLQDALLELENIKVSLTNPGISSALFGYLGLTDIEARIKKAGGVFSLVSDFCLMEKPGISDALIDAFADGSVLGIFETTSWKRRQNFAQTNRVMANIRPLSNLLGNLETEEPTFKDVVLRAYIFDLQRKQITLSKQEQASQSMWHYVQIAFGVLAIIVGFATLVFGFGTIPIAGGLAIFATAAKSLLLVLGVTLLIKAVVTQFKLYGQKELDLRNTLIEMALKNAETFQALGQNISRNRDALATAGIEVIEQIALMAFSRFRVVEIAMEMQMHTDTVEMVMDTMAAKEN